MRIFQKATSLLLSFSLVLSLLPNMVVSAAEGTKDSTRDSGILLGYEPPPFDTSNLLFGGDTGPHEVLRASSLPSKYCLFTGNGNTVDEITPELKDQLGWGACWTFSSLGSAESSLYQNGSNDVDFSERHLAYFTYNGTNDPDKPEDGTRGDTFIADTAYGDSAPYMSGGNFFKAIATLSRGVGAEMEENVPYPTEDDFIENNAKYFNRVDEEYHFASHYQLREANFLPNKDADGNLDGTEIKKTLMEGNSVGLSYCADSASYNTVGGIKYPTYFNGTYHKSNHAVQIVGWDDDIARASFTDKNGVNPSVDGAWLIKNTWGNTSHGGTYFYLSYEDQTISMLCSLIADQTPQDSPRYAHNYQYDGDGQTAMAGNSGEWVGMANLFTATGDQTLEAVAFYTTSPQASYSIQIYTNLTDTDSPVSGTKAFATEQPGIQAYAGYHTVDLEQPVPVKSGEKFSVVITMLSPNARPVAVENDESGYSEAGISKGQSFINGGGSWTDLTSVANLGNACIKAFTNDQSAEPKITVTPTVASVTKGQTQQFAASVSGTEDKRVTWTVTGNASTDTAIDTDGTLTVALGETASSLTVRAASTAEPSVYAEATVTVVAPVAPSITISPESVSVTKGLTQQFAASVSGTEDKRVTWTVTGNASTDTAIDTDGTLTVALGETASSLTVRAASTAEPSVYAEATVTVVAPVPPSVTISPESVSVTKGLTQQFTASVSGTEDKRVTWTVTGNTSADTIIDTDGTLTVALGETASSLTVRAAITAGPSVYAEATVTVTQPAPSITIAPAATSVTKGMGQQFTALVSGLEDTGVTWTVSGKKSANTVITQTGKLTVGLYETASSLTVKVTSTKDSSVYAEATVQVLTPVYSPNIAITPYIISVSKGAGYSFSAGVTGLEDKDVNWSLSGNYSQYTSISQDGTLTVGLDEIASSITVKAVSKTEPSVYGMATVLVLSPPPKASISILPENVQIFKGQSQQFTATVHGLLDERITWSVAGNTSNGTSISSDGKLMVGPDETATILAVIATSVGDPSVSAQAAVTVLTPDNKPGIVILPESAQVEMGKSLQLAAAVSGLEDKRVIWTLSGNRSAHTVISPDGILTVGADETTAVVTVRAALKAKPEVYAQASITVIPPKPTPTISISTYAKPEIGKTQQFIATVTGITDKTVTWSVSGNNSKSTVIDQNGNLTIASSETATSLTVKAVCKAAPSVYAEYNIIFYPSTKKTVRFYSLGSSIKTQTVVIGSSLSSVTLPVTLNAIVNGSPNIAVPVLWWESSPAFSTVSEGVFTFKPVLSSDYLVEDPDNLPQIKVTVLKKISDNSSWHPHGGGGGGGGGGSRGGGGGAAAAVPNTVAVTQNGIGTSVVVSVEPDSAGTVTNHVASISSTATFYPTTAQNNSTAQNHARIEFILPGSTVLSQLNNAEVSTVDLSVKVPYETVYNTNPYVDIIMNLGSDVLQTAQVMRKDITVSVTDTTTGRQAYQWIFSGPALAGAAMPLGSVNMALNIKSTALDATINSAVPSAVTGTVLTFANNGVLPAPATVKAYVGDQGYTAGQTLYLYYYNPATKGLETVSYPVCKVDQSGYASVVISHCSQYVLLPQQVSGSSVILDTGKALSVQAGKTYQIMATASSAPSISSANGSVFKVKKVASKGNRHYFQVVAVGKKGGSAGLYVNGEKSPRIVATVI